MLKNIFFLGVGLILLSACNTKFSVNGEYIETPVVHFILDQGDKVHLMKLNKTFLEEGNANEFAKNAELSYFDNVVAVVKEIKNGSVLRQWTLYDTIIENKKDGAFYGPEQKLYAFRANDLDEDAIYRLEVDIDNGNHIVKGQTELVKGAFIKSPSINQRFLLADNDVNLNGYKTHSVQYAKTPNGAIYNTRLITYYKEYSTSGEEVKTVTMNLGEQKASSMVSSNPSVAVNGERYFELLGARIKASSDVHKRTLEAVEIVQTVGSNDLLTYMMVNEPTSSLAQNKPTYSNVEGALGIFTSRSTVRQYKPNFLVNEFFQEMRCFDQNTRKELCTGQHTVHLHFCSIDPQDVNTNYHCD